MREYPEYFSKIKRFPASAIAKKNIDNAFWRFVMNSEKLDAMIRSMTGQAAFALGLISCEWALYAVDAASVHTAGNDYVEANWAYSIDNRYFKQAKTPLKVKWANKTMEETVMDVAGELGHIRNFMGYFPPVNWIRDRVRLAYFLLSDKKGFEAWLEKAMARLIEYYPLVDYISDYDKSKLRDLEKEALWKGPPVPREIFDLECKYSPGLADKYLTNFLTSLKPETHKYLYSPDELRKKGFNGVPYGWPQSNKKKK